MTAIAPLAHHEVVFLDGLIDSGCRDLLTDMVGREQALLHVNEIRTRVHERLDEFEGFTEGRKMRFNSALNRFLQSQNMLSMVRANRFGAAQAITEFTIDVLCLIGEPQR